jgi:hypothetical protein
VAELEMWLEERPEELELILVPALGMTHSLHHCRLAIIACQLTFIATNWGHGALQHHAQDPLTHSLPPATVASTHQAGAARLSVLVLTLMEETPTLKARSFSSVTPAMLDKSHQRCVNPHKNIQTIANQELER